MKVFFKILKITIVLWLLNVVLWSIMKYSSNETLFFDHDSYKKPALVALSHFPELKNARIHFRTKKNSYISHQAIPNKLSLLAPRSLRLYYINIAEDHKDHLDSTLFSNLNPKSRVGVIGHELSHILDYEDESTISIIIKGIKYLNDPQFRAKYERSTNLESFNRGLDKELISWSKQVHQYLELDHRGALYHSPEELKTLQDQLSNNQEIHK